MYKTIMLILFLSCFKGITQVNLEQKTLDFYHNLNKGDSTAICAFLHKDARVKHLSTEEVWDLSVSDFLTVAPKFKSNYFSEEIKRIEVHDFLGGFYYVDVYFDFYVEGSYSHSGIDHFCWSHRNKEVKIESIYSANFKPKSTLAEGKLELEKRLNSLLNGWHNSAAVADLDAYFGLMADDFIYLGTDPSERWSKDNFLTFCKPYFERKKTWDFKTNWRNWYFSPDLEIAWFEESLNTQMEECRGSGVFKKVNGVWKIAHYNLTVLIENEKIKKFIKLRKK